jgi:hypothetical protein
VTIPLGSYRIGYFPKVVTGCCYCKSYRVRLIASPSSALYDALGGSGTAILAALDRLVVKLQREQLPIHSEIAQIVLNIPISVSLSPTVSIVVS